jgi:probable F420-dependent oxidoreductase
MTDRRFRFGVVAGFAATGEEWVASARRAEELGFDVLLVPDTVQTLAPFPALAAGAACTRTLHVGTYVLSAPNREPGLVAWESTTLDTLTGGRFELGIGGGRPAADRDAAVLGRDFGTPGERLRRVAQTIAAVRAARDAAGGARPPILVAASRPRMLQLAAEQADAVALGLPPQATEDQLGRTVAALRDAAGARFGELELHLNIGAVAESPAALPERLYRAAGGDPREIAAAGGVGFPTGTPARIADVLRRRRDQFGVSYVAVSALSMEELAPVIERLRGTD